MNLKLIKFVAGCVFACYLFSLTQTAFAIEGLNISIPAGTNVILSWPSDTSETYLIQYRHTLDASDSWTTLADYYAPDFTTNITCFYDTNLDFGSGNTSGGSNIGNISLLGSSRANSSVADGHFLTMDEIMAMLMLPVATDYSSGLPQKFNRNSPAHNNPTPMDTTNSVSNLQDYYGNYHTNDNFFTCKISTPYADPPKPTYKVTDPWPTTGAWAAACQHAWNSSLDPDSLYQQLNGFVGFGGAHGGVYPTPSSDGSPYALTFDPEDPRGDVDWNQFRQVLFHPYVRNLIYFGHGGQNGLGYDPAIFNRYITAAEIANRLHTIPAGQTNRHAFRFVFIDACSTAAGNLPEAFGILHRENVPFDDYVNSSTRFSAYVGWPKEKAIGLMNARYPNYDHVNFMAWIQFEMMTYGNGVKQAIRNASHYPNVHWFGEDDLKVYGYWNLTIGGNNN